MIVASNQNDILTRFFEAGDMSIAPVRPSFSPSMDIQISSNFERLLFDLFERDGAAVAGAVQKFRETGTLPDGERLRAATGSVFSAFRTVDAGTLATIRETHETNGILILFGGGRQPWRHPSRPTRSSRRQACLPRVPARRDGGVGGCSNSYG